jgi:hypothetical protein
VPGGQAPVPAFGPLPLSLVQHGSRLG